MDSLAKRLARKLLELRGDTSQNQFAKQLGISNASLNRLELGNQNISLKTIQKICTRMKCDVADLFPKESQK